ncbi:hypothetical protein Trydic_g4272 [Trypoxylus dichotomus]
MEKCALKHNRIHAEFDCSPPLAVLAALVALAVLEVSSAGGICCVADRFCGDSTDCTIFDECSGGVPYKSTCAAGLCSDPSISACNYCSLVNC